MPRKLKSQERELVALLLCHCPEGTRFLFDLNERVVREMTDGGMGSLRFLSDREQRVRHRALSKAEFCDSDGVVVSVELTTDQFDDLFELDLWKVDFSPLQRFPLVSEVKFAG